MNERYARITRIASTQFGAVSLRQLDTCGVNSDVRRRWVEARLIEKTGARTYAISGSVPSWQRAAWAAMSDAEGAGFVAGRTAGRLNGLDGFVGESAEVLVRRDRRHLATPAIVASTRLPLTLADTVTIEGIRCLSAHRLILDAPLFGFDRTEIENAIDSAIRLKLLSEQRLRSAVMARHRRSINNGRALLDALVDAGGESRLERWFLRIVRQAGLPRPELQRVWRSDGRTIARVDALIPAGLVVELAGHGTHSSRRARQRDEQRRTELTLRGLRVIAFTYEDIRDRPGWVVDRLVEALSMFAA